MKRLPKISCGRCWHYRPPEILADPGFVRAGSCTYPMSWPQIWPQCFYMPPVEPERRTVWPSDGAEKCAGFRPIPDAIK